MTVAALIVAAGRGTRAAGSEANPKQYARLGDETVLALAMKAFVQSGRVDHVLAVIHPDDAAHYEAAVAGLEGPLLQPVHGGATRQSSVRLGLEALSSRGVDLVLIHDAARPFVSRGTIARVVEALGGASAAIAAVPLSDTLKRAGDTGLVEATVDRSGLWRAQTPQGFRFAEILDAHRRAAAAGIETLTDDAAVAEWAGLRVRLVEGNDRNVKITTADDLTMARVLIDRAGGEAQMETRTGTGFDVHRFTAGDAVWLCGVRVPHTHKLEGHSDADVGLHALTDALLGAIGNGDIGQHFPPSDMRWKDAASHIFLAHAGSLVAARGGRIVNVDVTILAEAPRVRPHREAMRARIAEILGIAIDRVGVKATTTEGLGFTGRREGIAAMATANVAVPLGLSDHAAMPT